MTLFIITSWKSLPGIWSATCFLASVGSSKIYASQKIVLEPAYTNKSVALKTLKSWF